MVVNGERIKKYKGTVIKIVIGPCLGTSVG